MARPSVIVEPVNPEAAILMAPVVIAAEEEMAETQMPEVLDHDHRYFGLPGVLPSFLPEGENLKSEDDGVDGKFLGDTFGCIKILNRLYIATRSIRIIELNFGRRTAGGRRLLRRVDPGVAAARGGRCRRGRRRGAVAAGGLRAERGRARGRRAAPDRRRAGPGDDVPGSQELQVRPRQGAQGRRPGNRALDEAEERSEETGSGRGEQD